MTDLHWGSRSHRQQRQLLQITPFVRRVPWWGYCCARSWNKHLASRFQEDVGRGTTGQERQTRANDDQGKLETNWKTTTTTTTTDTSKPLAPDKLHQQLRGAKMTTSRSRTLQKSERHSAGQTNTVYSGKTTAIPPRWNKAENMIFFSLFFSLVVNIEIGQCSAGVLRDTLIMNRKWEPCELGDEVFFKLMLTSMTLSGWRVILLRKGLITTGVNWGRLDTLTLHRPFGSSI